MFRFEHPVYLYALLLLPLLAVFFWLAWNYRQRALARFATADLLARLVPGLSGRRHWVKFGLLLLGLAFLIVGWANPQYTMQRQQVQREGIDIMIALDVSRSMLAEDIQPSRLERAKRFAQSLVDALAGNNVGLELFACSAFIQVPITTDYAFLKLAITTASPDQATAQGTSLTYAIDLAEGAFAEESRNNRALILISDGEAHDEYAADEAAAALDEGLTIYTVGVGQEEGSFIPVILGGRQDYLRDASGEPVRTRLEAESLQAIADAGGGQYYPLTNNTDAIINSLRTQLDALEKREFELRSFTDFASYFQYFIGMALFFVILEYSLSYRKK